MTSQSNSPTPDHQPRPWIDLLVSIIIPSVILMKFSGDEHLGSVNALIIGLAFPLGWGLFELVRYHKKNFIALLGLISVGLTGGIGLLELDAGWLAIKEAAVPAVIGLAVLVSTRTRYPLVRTLLYNPNVLDVDKIQASLEEKSCVEEFEGRLLKASYFFAGTFLFSSNESGREETARQLQRTAAPPSRAARRRRRSRATSSPTRSGTSGCSSSSAAG